MGNYRGCRGAGSVQTGKEKLLVRIAAIELMTGKGREDAEWCENMLCSEKVEDPAQGDRQTLDAAKLKPTELKTKVEVAHSNCGEAQSAVFDVQASMQVMREQMQQEELGAYLQQRVNAVLKGEADTLEPIHYDPES